MKRIALIGVTGYGGVHFRNLRALAEEGAADLAAAAVVNPESPAAAEPLAWLRAHGASVYPTAEALFAAEAGHLDLVCLPVGIAAHETLATAALAAGANVLVEKPAAGCTAAVDRMIAAERAAAPLRVAVGFQHVSAPEVRQIKRLLASGAIGRPLRVVVAGIWPRNDAYYARNGWAGRLAASDGTPVRDSPANNAFAHYVNLGLYFASTDPSAPAEPQDVEGALYRARPEIETFDACLVRFRAQGGAQVSIALSHAAEANVHPRLRVEAERGTVRWELDGTWEVRDASGAVLASGSVEPPHTAMFRAALDLAGGAEASVPPVLCTLAMARAQVRAVELLTEALPVTPLARSAVRRADGQWTIPGLPELFDRFWKSGEFDLPDWR